MQHVKDSSYFSHDSNARRDPKILALRSVYGMEGYGWFWTIIEMLREQPGYKLSIDSKYAYKAIAMELHCDESKAIEFIQDCIKEFGIFETDGEQFWSQSLLRRMEIKETKSNKAREAALARWGKDEESESNASAMQSHSEKSSSNASKVKESKVNKKESKESTVLVPQHEVAAGLDAGNPTGYPTEFESFWSEYPRKIRKADAYAAWLQLINRNVQAADLVKAARNYARTCRGKKPDHLLHPASFLAPVNQPFRVYLEARGDPGKNYAHQHPVTDLQQAIKRKTKLGLEE